MAKKKWKRRVTGTYRQKGKPFVLSPSSQKLKSKLPRVNRSLGSIKIKIIDGKKTYFKRIGNYWYSRGSKDEDWIPVPETLTLFSKGAQKCYAEKKVAKGLFKRENWKDCLSLDPARMRKGDRIWLTQGIGAQRPGKATLLTNSEFKVNHFGGLSGSGLDYAIVRFDDGQEKEVMLNVVGTKWIPVAKRYSIHSKKGRSLMNNSNKRK